MLEGVTIAEQQFLLIEGTDFTRPIFGSGNATVVSSIIRGFSGRVALVGCTSESHTLGQWIEIEVLGKTYPFLPIITSERIRDPKTKSANLDLAIGLFKYRKSLAEIGIGRVFTRTYSILWALNLMRQTWDVCFYYPGLANPMLIGKKVGVTRYFSDFYSRIQARMLRKSVTIAYAAASQHAIDEYNAYIATQGVPLRVDLLTTAVDPDVVHPFPMRDIREKLSIASDDLVLCFVGRLAMIKGIPLLLDVVAHIKARLDKHVTFLVVGDGELRDELEQDTKLRGLEREVRFLGMLPKPEVVQAIAAADVCVVGSIEEGFSNAMLEQIGVGKPIVSTTVSGATDIITNGVNGFVVETRDAKLFAEKVMEASLLSGVEEYNLNLVARRYSEANLWDRISNEWLARGSK